MGDISFHVPHYNTFFNDVSIQAAIAITICFSQNHCAVHLKDVVYCLYCDAFSVQFLFYQKK